MDFIIGRASSELVIVDPGSISNSHGVSFSDDANLFKGLSVKNTNLFVHASSDKTSTIRAESD
jgi:hypothetical protein